MSIVTEAAPEASPPTTRRRRLVLAVGAVVAVALAGAWVLRSATPHLYTGTVLQQSAPAPDMSSLRYADGSVVDLGAYEGKVVMIYFGYSHCPDVCPTALSMAATAVDRLGSGDQDRVQLLMVTVDPERDRPAELQEYVEFFDERFLGVSGEVPDLERVAAQYGIYHQRGEGTAATGYLVDHTATMLAIDGGGSLRIVWPPDVDASELSADIEELLR